MKRAHIYIVASVVLFAIIGISLIYFLGFKTGTTSSAATTEGTSSAATTEGTSSAATTEGTSSAATTEGTSSAATTEKASSDKIIRIAFPFKDCVFIRNNLSSVQLIFDDFNETYTPDNCYEQIKDEKIAQNVTFLKVSGFKFNDNIDYHATGLHYVGERDLEKIANTFKGVRALDISYNPTLEFRNVSSHFKNLVFLNASHNDIVHSSLINEMPQLSKIDLSFNIIESLDSVEFSKSIENDDIIIHSPNSSKELVRSQFNPSKLHSVLFGANQLSNAPELLNRLGSSIERLQISGNFIGKLNATTFQRFTKLSNLNLSRTNLSDFDFHPFEKLTLLSTLDISNNSLISVNFSSQVPFSKLETINLNWNRLTELKGLDKTTFPALKNLSIEGNSISCEHISNLKWDGLEVTGRSCNEKLTVKPTNEFAILFKYQQNVSRL